MKSAGLDSPYALQMQEATTAEAATAITPVRTEQGQFPKGISGNPKGRPKKQTVRDIQLDLEIALREHITVDKVKRIINKLIEKAELGNIPAAKLILDKVISNARDSEDAGASDGRTIVFHIENALIKTTNKQEPAIPIQVIDVTPIEVKTE